MLTRRALQIGVALVGIVLLIWLASVARRGAPTWPVADNALIEIYTRHATVRNQLLGPYSEYGWYHPGPFVFYLLAPFYVISGRTAYGLDLGALAINLVSMLIIASILARRRGLSPVTALLLLAGLFLYFARLPDLLTSAWNPHISIWPFAALLVCTAATVDGSVELLPAVVCLASLVTQTHVAFAPVALTLGSIAAGSVVWIAVRERERRLRTLAWTLVSLVVVQLLWLPVLRDQLTARPGNLTKIWHFFFEANERQTLSATIGAWSSMLVGIIRPSLAVAIRVGFYPGSTSTQMWMIAAGALIVVALPLVALLRWREGQRFESILALLCFIASAIGVWSVWHIVGLIGDHLLFWLSILGVFDLAIIVSAVIALVGRSLVRTWFPPRLVGATATVFVLAAVVVGAGHLVFATRSGHLRDENESVRRLTAEMRLALASMGAHKPLVRMEVGNNWGIGVGLMLQLARAGIPFAADADFASRFDPNLATNGQEDVLMTLGDIEAHQELARRPGNVTIASSNWRVRLYVDAVSLVDHPEYRHTRNGIPTAH